MNTKNLQRFTFFVLLCGLFCIVSLPVLAQGRFRVTLNGFVVNQQTNEGLVTRDGAGDEVMLVSHVGTVDSSGRWSPNLGLTATSIITGMQRGNCYPAATPCPSDWRRTSPVPNANPLPVSLFEGIIGTASAAVIIPTIWEWDGVDNEEPRRKYARQIALDQNNLTNEVAFMIRTPSPLLLDKFLRSGNGMRINNTVTHTGGFPQDRPIGMQATRLLNQFGFTPQVLVLTFQAADFISRTNFGNGPGVIPVRYVDDSFLSGDYMLFLQVERTDVVVVPPCPADFTSTFTGEAVMTTDNKYAPGPFTRPVSMTVNFTQCRTRIQITNFVEIMTDPFNITNPLNGNTISNTTFVTQTGGGNGIFTPSDGSLEIPITLHFRHSAKQDLGIFAAPSDLMLRLTTQSPGSPKDLASGILVLVGSGQFSGGFLGGSTGNITVRGSFEPRPRP